MSDVGNLQANLTLDLSDFRAGMQEVGKLAAEISGVMQKAFKVNSLSAMQRDLAQMVQSINQLKASFSSLQSQLNSKTGADMFASMKTHTSVLQTNLARITKDAPAAKNGVTALSNAIGTAADRSTNLRNNLQNLNTSSLSKSVPTLNFSKPLQDLTQLRNLLSEVTTLINSMGSIDLETGELTGGDQLTTLYQIVPVTEEITQNFIQVTNNIRMAALATIEWEQNLKRIAANAVHAANMINRSTQAMRSGKSDITAWVNGTEQLEQNTEKVAKNLQTTKGYAVNVQGIMGGIIISQAFYSLLNVMEELVAGSIEFAKNMQDASVAFEFLMAGQDVSSAAFLNALKSIALDSPLDTTQLASASRQLMAMGFTADAAVPALQILTDTAAVFSNSAGEMSDMISHVTLAFGQMVASGKVSAQELRQLYNAGIPIYELLSDGLGITMEMAKNIGHYNVDSATAVYAVLQQLQMRYEGASKALAQTFAGSMEVIRESIQQLLSYAWDDVFDDLTNKLSNLASFMKALVQITQAYGPGGMFQAIFPEESWDVLRDVLAGLVILKGALIEFGKLVAVVFGDVLSAVLHAGSVVLPTIGNMVGLISQLARAIYTATPAIRVFVQILGLLGISVAAAKGILLLGKAIYFLSGAKFIASILSSLVSSFVVMTSLSRPAVIAIMAIAGALLALALSSETAKAALSTLFGDVSDGLQDFAESLGLGFDLGDIAMPEFELPDTDDWAGGLSDLTDGLDDLTDATDEAGKSARDNLQSFDEVYKIDTDDDSLSGLGDSMSGILDSLAGLDGLDDMFDWTGDWLTDWGNLSAGIEGLTGSIGESLGNLGELATQFWDNLTGALSDNPAATGGLLGAAIGGVLGGILGGPGGAAIGAALLGIAGAIVGQLWAYVAEAFGLPVESATKATIVSAITGTLGGLIGFALAGVPGAIIGGAAGTGLGGIGSLIWDLLIQDFGMTEQQGAMGLITAIGSGITTAIITALKNGVEGVFGKGAVQGLDDLWAGITAIFTKQNFDLLWKTLAEAFKKGGIKELLKATTDIKTALTTALKAGLKGGIISAIAGISLDFLSAWLIGAVGEAIGKSEEEIAKGQEFSSWGGTILSIIGTIVGTIIAPGVGTLIGGLLGQLVGNLLGGLVGLFEKEITAFISSIVDKFVDVRDAIIEAFGNAIGQSEEEIAKGKEFASWGGTIVGVIGGIIGTVVAPGLGTIIGGLIGLLSGTIQGGLLGLIQEDVTTFFETLTSTIMAGWTTFSNEITTVIGPAFDTISEAIKQGWAVVTNFFDTVLTMSLEELSAYITEFLDVTIPAALEKFGGYIGYFLGTVTRIIRDFIFTDLPNAFDELTKIASDLMQNITTSLDNALSTVSGFIAEVYNSIKTFIFTTLPTIFKNAIASVKEFFSDVDGNLIKFKDSLFNGIKEVALTVKEFFTKTLPDIFKSAISNITSFVSSAGKAISNLVTEFANAFRNTLAQVTSFLSSLAAKFRKAASDVLQYGKTMVSNFLKGVQSIGTKVIDWFSSFIDSIVATVKSILSEMFDIGKNILEGFFNGIKSVADRIRNWVKSFVDGLVKEFKKALDIKSPSGVMEDIGVQTDEGLLVGLRKGMSGIGTFIKNTITDPIQSAFTSGMDNAFETTDLSKTLQNSMSMDSVDLGIDAKAINLDASLLQLATWAQQFQDILTNMVTQINSIFQGIELQLPSNIQMPISTQQLAPINAVNTLAAQTYNTPGTSGAIMEVLATLSEKSMESLSAKIALRVYEYIAPLFASLSTASQDQIIAYVGTLVADDRGLTQLEQKLRIIRNQENQRRGL